VHPCYILLNRTILFDSIPDVVNNRLGVAAVFPLRKEGGEFVGGQGGLAVDAGKGFFDMTIPGS
ncbi:MAG: hypothetical protein WBQ23_02260, partial [Bacteroidota bacterium]